MLRASSVRLTEEVGPVAMGEKGHLSRVLLECSLSDKLCVVREKQYEVIIVPALLVGGFLILLAIILWLFYQRTEIPKAEPWTPRHCLCTCI